MAKPFHHLFKAIFTWHCAIHHLKKKSSITFTSLQNRHFSCDIITTVLEVPRYKPNKAIISRGSLTPCKHVNSMTYSVYPFCEACISPVKPYLSGTSIGTSLM